MPFSFNHPRDISLTKRFSQRLLGTLSALGLATLVACGSSNNSTIIEPELTNQEKAIAVISSIETGDANAVSYINPTNYTQHNLSVADGVDGFSAALAQLPAGSARADVKRAFTDGNYVVLHTDYDFFGPKAGFDIFRFEEGLIVEHWDNLQEIAVPNASGRTQLDGATLVEDLDKTAANKALVGDFVQDILVNGDMSVIGNYIDAEDDAYIQHNPNAGDGLAALGAYLGQLAEQGTPMIYSQNHIILGQGNFVITVSEGQFMNEHVAFYDLFRVKDGKIVEHWDAIEIIPPIEEWMNNNGKFGFD